MSHEPEIAPEATVAALPVPARGAHANVHASDLLAPEYRGLTIGLLFTIALIAMESLAVGTVMPMAAAELGDLELYGWVFSAFFLGSLIGIVVTGGALDRMPIRRPFLIGIGLFALGLALGGAAPSMPVLVAARFLQGLGGGVIPPTAYVAIGRSLPETHRPRMFAMLSTAWVVPGILGPSLAAVVGEALDWRWVFLGLLPFLAVAAGVALSALGHIPPPPVDSAAAGGRRPQVRRLPNALLIAAGAGIGLAGLTSPEPLLAVAATVLGLGLIIPSFRRLTPPGTLRAAPGLPAAILLRGVLTFGFFAVDAYIALLLQTWRGTTPLLTGLTFTAVTLAWAGGAWLQARYASHWSPRRLVRTGFAILAVTTALTIPTVLPVIPPAVMVVTWGLAGIGMGMAYATLSVTTLREAPPDEQGAASAALQLSDILGTALGVGVAGAMIAVGERAGGDGLGLALGAAFTLGLAVLVVGQLLGRRLPGPAVHPSV